MLSPIRLSELIVSVVKPEHDNIILVFRCLPDGKTRNKTDDQTLNPYAYPPNSAII